MSKNIQKLVTLTEGRNQKDIVSPEADSNMGDYGSDDVSTGTPSWYSYGPNFSGSDDGSTGTPSWYSYGSNSSVCASNVSSTNHSSVSEGPDLDYILPPNNSLIIMDSCTKILLSLI